MKIAEGKIAVFAGTTEGRVLASRLAGSQVAADVFVATEYGKERSRRLRIFRSMTGVSMRSRWRNCFRKRSMT